jgi:biotin transport system substrate-specific component
MRTRLESAPMSVTTDVALRRPAPTLADVAAPGRRSLARDTALVVGGAALTALAAQVAFNVPWTPVPYTLQTGAVLLVGTALGSWRGALSMLLYVLAGAVGAPVFAEGRSGLGAEAGGITPTLGYLVGFVVAAALVGWLAERRWDRSPLTAAGLMVLGNLVIYAIGVPVLALALAWPLDQAVQSGAVVFVPWDLAKVAVAAGLLPLAWRLARDPMERSSDHD